MKKETIKKVTQFTNKDVKVYYFLIGTRTFSLSMPSNFTADEITETAKELADKLATAIQTESSSDYAFRIINNKTEMFTYEPIKLDDDETVQD